MSEKNQKKTITIDHPRYKSGFKNLDIKKGSIISSLLTVSLDKAIYNSEESNNGKYKSAYQDFIAWMVEADEGLLSDFFFHR